MFFYSFISFNSESLILLYASTPIFQYCFWEVPGVFAHSRPSFLYSETLVPILLDSSTRKLLFLYGGLNPKP